MADTSQYVNPLVERYASREMAAIFSPDFKFRTWRRLWIALAETERELGLAITSEQIAALERHANDINYDVAEAREREIRHDVMAHVHAYGAQAPEARAILHWGATSAYVTDNCDLIQMAAAAALVAQRLRQTIGLLATFARTHRALACLGFTHFQAAQPTTLGKRACLWIQDLLLDHAELAERHRQRRFLGVKGATGTQASFLALFGGDHEKVRELDRRVAERMGFADSFLATGQTYPRKIDAQYLATLSGIAQSGHKFANDLRLLAHLREVEEPFEDAQVGSSAMAYKRNPMRAERLTALARLVICAAQNSAQTAAEQWLERTLDDSANKRIAVPEAFLATDAILILYANIAGGLVVHPAMIAAHLEQELPFAATENILMAAVAKGGDRQELHERLRVLAQRAAEELKEGKSENRLLKWIGATPEFRLSPAEIAAAARPDRFVGRAPEQVGEFLNREVEPILRDTTGGAVVLPADDVRV